MENQNNQTTPVENTEQVTPTEAVTESVLETSEVEKAQSTNVFPKLNKAKTFDFKKVIMILSIVGLGLFLLWFILSNALLKKGGFDEELEKTFVYGKAGDAALKVFASLIIVVAAGILGFITYEFAMLIKAKKDKKTTACWGSAIASIMATLLIVMILLIVDMAAKQTFSEYGESIKVDRWINKHHFVQIEVAILATMFALTLVGSLVTQRSSNFGKYLSMTNFILACAGLLFFVLATAFAGSSSLNDINRESKTQQALIYSGIYTYGILAVLAGTMMITIAGQIAIFVVESFNSLKSNKAYMTKLILLSVAFVLVIVFMSLLGSKLSKGNMDELIGKWIEYDFKLLKPKYVWRTNAVFAAFATAGMVLGGVTNLVYDKIKRI